MVRDWLILRDTAGDIRARFDSWLSLHLRREINAPGRAELVLDGADNRTLLFGLDYLLEFWREDRAANIQQYREAVALMRNSGYSYDKDGQLKFAATFVGLEDLLGRRIIYNAAGSARTDKSGAAETVMREYVIEQAGVQATTPSGRLANGYTRSLVVPVDRATGGTWSGARAWRNLLEVIQEIARSMNMAFYVEWDSEGSPNYAYEPQYPVWLYHARPKPWGADRRVNGIGTDGRNAAGNFPVLFSAAHGNAISPAYEIIREGEANVAVVLGRGNEDERNVRERTLAGTTYPADSPWNRREFAVHATQEYLNASLDARGDEALQRTVPRIDIALTIVQHPATLYGREYYLGDMVTCEVAGYLTHRTISAVTFRVEGHPGDFSEKIDVELSE